MKFCDHYCPIIPILITINTDEGYFKKGKNYWKFNKVLLKDNVYVTGVRKLVEEKKLEFEGLNNQIKWELIKFEIRKFTMAFSKKVARKKKETFRIKRKNYKRF